MRADLTQWEIAHLVETIAIAVDNPRGDPVAQVACVKALLGQYRITAETEVVVYSGDSNDH